MQRKGKKSSRLIRQQMATNERDMQDAETRTGEHQRQLEEIMIKNKGNRSKEIRMQLTKTHDQKRLLEIKIVVVISTSGRRRAME